MAKIHYRPNSSNAQIQLSVGGKLQSKSLYMHDEGQANAVAEAITDLQEALTKRQIMRQSTLMQLIDEIFQAASVPNPWVASEAPKLDLPSMTNQYLHRAKDIDPISVRRYSNDLAKHVGGKLINTISVMDCQKWYDELLTTISPGTAANRVAMVSPIFDMAVKLELITRNPMKSLTTQRIERGSKLPMPDADFDKIISWLKGSSIGDAGSWITAMMIARYAGCSLLDAVGIRPCDITIIHGQKVMEYRRVKTDAYVITPLLGPLTGILQPGGGTLPFCWAIYHKSAPALSNRFAWIMDQAGVDAKITILPNGRSQRGITFHSLRHRFVSWLSEIGVPKDIRKLMAGHSSDSAHDGYDHTTIADVLPRLFTALNGQPPLQPEP